MHTLSYKQTISRVGFAYFTAMLLTQLGQAAVLGVLSAFAPAAMQADATVWLLTQGPMYLLGLPCAFLILRTLPNTAEAPERHALGAKHFAKLVAITFAITILGNLVSVAITTLIGLAKESGVVQNPLMTMTEGSAVWANFVFGAVLVPIGEEVLFRLLPYRKLAAFGGKTYVLVTALVFSCAHGNLSQMVYAFFIGALLAHVYAKTGHLRNTIAIHILINTYGLVLAPLALQNQIALVVLMVAVYTLVIVGVIFWVRGRKSIEHAPAAQPLPEAPVREALLNPGMLFYLAFTAAIVLIVTLS